MILRRPRCGNRKPYCVRGGAEMKCVKENAEHFVFACVPPGCGQVEIIIRPEHKQKLRERAARQQLSPPR